MRWTVFFAAAALAAASDTPDNSKLPVKPPKGAVILLDGKGAGEWELDKHWKYADGVLVVDPAESHRGCRIATKKTFGDYTLHVEFWLPLMAEATGQARSNSGIFLAGRYEVQILDTYGHPPEDNGAGGLYKVATPRVNASLAPEQWQSYDIQFRTARAQKDGVIERPRVTVVYNGVKIHDNLELKVFATPNGKFDNFALSGPILLQNHHAAVKFRNIWLVEKP
jgi:hypothetical protein